MRAQTCAKRDGLVARLVRPKIDLAAEQRGVRRQAVFAFLVTAPILALGAFGLPAVYGTPVDLAERFAFVIRADLILGLWVLIAVRMVSRIRFVSAEDSAGSAYAPPSPRLAVPSAFLQNTLEQAFVALVSHLALATIPGGMALGYIAAAVVLFSLGRLTFLLGYSRGAHGRAFGMVVTVLPTLGAAAWVLAHLAGSFWR